MEATGGWSGARKAESCSSSGAAGGTDDADDVDADAGCGADVAAGAARGSTPIGARMCAKATAMKASADAIASCR